MSLSRREALADPVRPGEVRFGGAPAILSTLLGSCVAITMWHPARQQGGLCHYMLPTRPDGRRPPGSGLDGRYGDEALQLLLQAGLQAGCPPDQCEFKLFGGGRMYGCRQCAAGPCDAVHERNVEQALELATAHGLLVVAQHLGGDGHRQLIFELDGGAVWLRHVATPPQPGAGR